MVVADSDQVLDPMNVCLFIEKILSKEPELEDYDVEASADWANDPVSQQPEADEAANSAQGFGQVCFRQLPVLYPPPPVEFVHISFYTR